MRDLLENDNNHASDINDIKVGSEYEHHTHKQIQSQPRDREPLTG